MLSLLYGISIITNCLNLRKYQWRN